MFTPIFVGERGRGGERTWDQGAQGTCRERGGKESSLSPLATENSKFPFKFVFASQWRAGVSGEEGAPSGHNQGLAEGSAGLPRLHRKPTVSAFGSVLSLKWTLEHRREEGGWPLTLRVLAGLSHWPPRPPPPCRDPELCRHREGRAHRWGDRLPAGLAHPGLCLPRGDPALWLHCGQHP